MKDSILRKIEKGKYIRLDGTGYFRVSNVDYKNKTVDVFSNSGIDTYDFEEVIYDDLCEKLNKAYESSDEFKEKFGNGMGELLAQKLLKN